MSTTGNWGDKIILTLTSDGIRRHKNWCTNYRNSDNFCAKHCERCIGSAHCEDYETLQAEEMPIFKQEEHKPSTIREENNEGAKIKPKEEYYRLAGRGDKLIHKTVLVRSTPYIFSIARVVYEDFYYFKVEHGGRIHKYDKRTAFRSNSVYILTEA